MTVFGKKFLQLLELLGANLTGVEALCFERPAGVAYTASTISVAASDNSINDSANGLPIIPVGAAVNLSGFVDVPGEFNAEHVVVSSTASKLVTETDFTADEAAGASVTVQEPNKSYRIAVDELANFIAAAGLPNPIVGSTFKDSRETVYMAPSSSLNVTNGNAQQRTLAANETLEITMANSDCSIMLVNLITGAYTATIGASIDGWIGGTPTSISANHWLGFVSIDGGTTIAGVDLGAYA